MSGPGKIQNKCVSVYWTPEFLEDLDELCRILSVRRNDFIKEAVREKYGRDMSRLIKSGKVVVQ